MNQDEVSRPFEVTPLSLKSFGNVMDHLNGTDPLRAFAFVELPINRTYEGGSLLFVSKGQTYEEAMDLYFDKLNREKKPFPEWAKRGTEVAVLELVRPQSVSGNTIENTMAVCVPLRVPSNKTKE
jgi:hypothetical protein